MSFVFPLVTIITSTFLLVMFCGMEEILKYFHIQSRVYLRPGAPAASYLHTVIPRGHVAPPSILKTTPS